MHQRWMVPVVSFLGLAACSRRTSDPAEPAPQQAAAPVAPMPAAPMPAAPAPAVHAGHAAGEAPGAHASSAPGSPAQASAHGAGEHGHGSPHGGVVMSVPGGHLEAKLERSGRIAVWLLDGNQRTLPAQGATGRARLVVADAQEVPLVLDPSQNALVGQVPAPIVGHVVGVVTVTRPGGQPINARFSFHLEAGGHSHYLHLMTVEGEEFSGRWSCVGRSSS